MIMHVSAWGQAYGSSHTFARASSWGQAGGSADTSLSADGGLEKCVNVNAQRDTIRSHGRTSQASLTTIPIHKRTHAQPRDELRRLTACVFAVVFARAVSALGVGHTSVHGDCDSCAWGSGVCARVVLESSSRAHCTTYGTASVHVLPAQNTHTLHDHI